MKYISIVVLLLLISCSTVKKDKDHNYKMIDMIIHNPDTLRILGRDTIYFPNPKAKTKYREYSEYSLNWFKERADCFKANGYKIIDERYSTIEGEEYMLHKVQIQCNNSELKATFIFSNDLKKYGYWRFGGISPLNIGEWAL
jgi:hypothetical protein